MQAQDLHYAQPAASPLNFNPGLTGVFDGDQRFGVNIRRQWSSIPVPFMQLSGAFDQRFSDKKGRPTPWAGGAIFNYDRTGDARLSFLQVGFSGAYSHRLFPKKKSMLTLAIAGSAIHRAFDIGSLSWDDQYTLKDGYVENTATKEVFETTSRLLADVSAGFNLHLPADSSRTALDIGFGAFHLNEPQKNFFGEAPDQLDARLGFQVAGTVQLSQQFDLLFALIGQFQGIHQMGMLGVSGQYHLSSKKTRELALQLGLHYRFSDAIIPVAALRYSAWQVYLSYDLNLSPLREATLRRGGPELSVVYTVRKVPTKPFCKFCPAQM